METPPQRREVKKTPIAAIVPCEWAPLRKTVACQRLYVRASTHALPLVRNNRVSVGAVCQGGRLGKYS